MLFTQKSFRDEKSPESFSRRNLSSIIFSPWSHHAAWASQLGDRLGCAGLRAGPIAQDFLHPWKEASVQPSASPSAPASAGAPCLVPLMINSIIINLLTTSHTVFSSSKKCSSNESSGGGPSRLVSSFPPSLSFFAVPPSYFHSALAFVRKNAAWLFLF